MRKRDKKKAKAYKVGSKTKLNDFSSDSYTKGKEWNN